MNNLKQRKALETLQCNSLRNAKSKQDMNQTDS